VKKGDLVMCKWRAPIFTLTPEGTVSVSRNCIANKGDLMIILGAVRNHYFPIMHPIHGRLWIYHDDVEILDEAR